MEKLVFFTVNPNLFVIKLNCKPALVESKYEQKPANYFYILKKKSKTRTTTTKLLFYNSTEFRITVD